MSYAEQVEIGDYGLVVIAGELFEYDDDEFVCCCEENACDRQRRDDFGVGPEPRINLLRSCWERSCGGDGGPCEECGCGNEALCISENGAEVTMPYELLDAAGVLDRMSPAVPFPPRPCIYLVRMMPDKAPLRVKAGFSKNLQSRLNTYRTASPTSKLLDVRDGDECLEKHLLDALRKKFHNVGGEVFDANDPEGLDALVRLFHEVGKELGYGEG